MTIFVKFNGAKKDKICLHYKQKTYMHKIKNSRYQ